MLTELAQNSCGGMNSDTVKKYFETLKDVIQLVERENGHALQGNEIMNIDETGFDLCNCTKTQRVIIRTSKYKRQPKALHQGRFVVLICA